jgi:NAD-dependent deacetylase
MTAISIARDDRLFVLTGAGISAESGIPTFRDAGGLWRKYRSEEVASPHAWRRDPRLVWDFYSMRRRAASTAQPNPGHVALAALERTLQDRFFLCTQNVDNLYELAGPQRVLHMHGELFKSRCDSCRKPPFDDTNLYESPADLPAALAARSFVRTSAGLAKLPSISTVFSKRSANARCSSPSALPAQ